MSLYSRGFMDPIQEDSPAQVPMISPNGNLRLGMSPAISPSSSNFAGNGKKRKLASFGEHSDSQESQDDDPGPPKARRACNECRQQKLKCDVRTDPFVRCARCNKHNLECRIDANFKRVGKRSRHMAMEREIADLRQQLAYYEAANGKTKIVESIPSLDPPSELKMDPTTALHHGAADSLLDLSRGSKTMKQPRAGRGSTKARTLDSVYLTGPQIDELFKEFYTYYQPFLPILEPDTTVNQTYDLCPLLFWVVIAVAARRHATQTALLDRVEAPVNKMLAEVVFANPQNYQVVKALAILCTWPLPKKKTSKDPTWLFSGMMMEIALQTGLHRPSNVQDFYTRQRIELRDEDVRDRLRTWVCCNIVAQEMSTAFGQPPRTVYDFNLTSLKQPSTNDPKGLSLELFWRLQIERFCNRISLNFYNNRNNPIGITSADERAVWMNVLMEEYQRLSREIEAQGSPINKLYLHAAGLHLHLSAFFDSSSAPNYVKDLLNLWFATKAFLRTAKDLKLHSVSALPYMTHHNMMMMLGAGTSLMKLLNSFFATHVDEEDGRKIFSENIQSVRDMSVRKDDLPARLAEALSQLWRHYREGDTRSAGDHADDRLKLRIQARGSMSVLFDSVWQWREKFSFPYDGGTSRLDSASNNPTLPTDPPQDTTPNDPAVDFNAFTNAEMMSPTAMLGGYPMDPNFDVFDPVSVMLDDPVLGYPSYSNTTNNMSFMDSSGFYG